MYPDSITRQSTWPATEHGLARLLSDLPTQWRGDTIGPGIDAWEQRIETGQATRLHLGGIPVAIRAELAWMAHWQYQDGYKVAVSEFNVAAAVLRWMAETNRCTIDSVLSIDAETFTRHHGVWFELRHGRLPSIGSASAMRHVLFGYPRHGLIARVNDRPWWTLDEWVPRCDPRIPLRDREPRRSDSCRPGQAQIPWMAESHQVASRNGAASGNAHVVQRQRPLHRPADVRPMVVHTGGSSRCLRQSRQCRKAGRVVSPVGQRS